MSRYPIVIVAGAFLLGMPPGAAVAQQYSFGVPSMQMQATVLPDAAARIVYDITFQNSPGAHPIDIVDIGVPHAGYDLRNVQASIDGRALGDIRHSTEVKPGFEIHLAAGTIPPGQKGVLHVEFTVSNMAYQDTTRSDYASLRITPTWFGEQYVVGNTHLQVAIHLARSVKPDEALHQGLPFANKVLTKDGTSVTWDWPATRLTARHLVGVSFPKRDLERVVKKTRLDLLMDWFTESIQARVVVGVIFLAMFGFLFFRFSGGTGVSVYLFLSAVAVVAFVFSPGLELLSLPLAAILIGLNEWFLDRRKMGYMPPIAQVEGGGIKRGLTAPEAAALLELPLARVLSLVIFGMLKKGIVRQVQADPLIVEVDQELRLPSEPAPVPDEQSKFYREAGQKRGVAVHGYEQPFLYLLQHNPGKPVKEVSFSAAMRQLIQGTAERLKGFNLVETKEYYQAIVRRAVQQAAAIGDIPQREKEIDRNFEWILMDDNFPTVFTYGRPYQPTWSRGSGGSVGSGPGGGGSGSPGQTTFTDVAASFTGWAQNTMGSLASSILPGSLSVPQSSGGFLDLSGADRLTGQFFESLAEAAAKGGSGGGGGGGGGCACAGCACACACAGGGR